MIPDIETVLPGFAPVTFHGGFVESCFDSVVSEYGRWLTERARPYVSEFGDSGLRLGIRTLAPLQDPWNRILIVETESNWSGVYCNGLRVADVTTAVAVLGSRLKTRSAYYASCPPLRSKHSPFRTLMQGALKFAFFDESAWPTLEPTRIVQLLQDDSRWTFYQKGQPLTSEDYSVYRRRSVQERLSTSRILQNLRGLGIHADDERRLGPRFAIIEDVALTKPDGLELAEARRSLEIEDSV